MESLAIYEHLINSRDSDQKRKRDEDDEEHPSKSLKNNMKILLFLLI